MSSEQPATKFAFKRKHEFINGNKDFTKPITPFLKTSSLTNPPLSPPYQFYPRVPSSFTSDRTMSSIEISGKFDESKKNSTDTMSTHSMNNHFYPQSRKRYKQSKTNV